MKYALPTVLILVLSGISFAISVEEVVKLSELKTGDDLILEVIQKEGLDQPITSKDIVQLKEQGVSDRVIRYMLQVSDPGKKSLRSEEGESVMVSENLRAYYTITKDGRKVRVITNLDENGKRMGGELPPSVEQEKEEKAPYEASSPEVRIVIDTPHYRDPGPEYTPEEWEKYGLADYYWRYQPVPEVPEYGYTDYPYYGTYLPYAPYYGTAPYSHFGKKYSRSYGYVDQSLQGKQNRFLSGPDYPPVDSGKVRRQRPRVQGPKVRKIPGASAGARNKKPH